MTTTAVQSRRHHCILIKEISDLEIAGRLRQISRTKLGNEGVQRQASRIHTGLKGAHQMRNGLRALVRAGRSTKARVGIGFAAGVWPGWQRRTTRGPGRLADGVKGFVAFFVSSSFLGAGWVGRRGGGGLKLLRHRFFRLRPRFCSFVV
jgi:hypothetical protein